MRFLVHHKVWLEYVTKPEIWFSCQRLLKTSILNIPSNCSGSCSYANHLSLVNKEARHFASPCTAEHAYLCLFYLFSTLPWFRPLDHCQWFDDTVESLNVWLALYRLSRPIWQVQYFRTWRIFFRGSLQVRVGTSSKKINSVSTYYLFTSSIVSGLDTNLAESGYLACFSVAL